MSIDINVIVNVIFGLMLSMILVGVVIVIAIKMIGRPWYQKIIVSVLFSIFVFVSVRWILI